MTLYDSFLIVNSIKSIIKLLGGHTVTTLAVIGSLLCLAGIFNLSNATSGVGLIAAACFLGIFARLWQATTEAEHAKSRHEEIIKVLEAIKKQ